MIDGATSGPTASPTVAPPGPPVEGHGGTARVVDGRYRLIGRLGVGGMGTVHRAHDLLLDREVAVKLLRSADDPVDRARLRAEARFAGGLQHPGIVRVYDYGEERTDVATTPYVVLQLVEGTPLSQRLREQGALPPAEVARLVAGIADALTVAHAAGVVHRDLKPSNVIVTDDGAPVLVDFGVARSDAEDPLTETGLVVGTVDYLSPEQVEGARATPASDVYALGVVAHHCLTGASPFHRESQIATALAHLCDVPAALPGGVPLDLRTLVLSMLARDPEARPGAADVAARAAQAPRSRPVVLPPVPDGPPAPPRVLSAWTRRRIGIVAAASTVLLAGGLLAAIEGHGAATPPAAASPGAAGTHHRHRPAPRHASSPTPTPTPTPTPRTTYQVAVAPTGPTAAGAPRPAKHHAKHHGKVAAKHHGKPPEHHGKVPANHHPKPPQHGGPGRSAHHGPPHR